MLLLQARTIAAAPAPKAAHLVVLSTDASPLYLGPNGGSTTVQGSLLHPSNCQLKLAYEQVVSVVYATNVRPCSTSFTAVLRFGANPYTTYQTMRLVLTPAAAGLWRGDRLALK